jgi:hypothetical protein
VPHLTIRHPAPAAPTKPKGDDASISLDNLFDDVEDKKGELQDDAKENLPVLEKPGDAVSKVTKGKRAHE